MQMKSNPAHRVVKFIIFIVSYLLCLVGLSFLYTSNMANWQVDFLYDIASLLNMHIENVYYLFVLTVNLFFAAILYKLIINLLKKRSFFSAN